jgi:acylphosphatase
MADAVHLRIEGRVQGVGYRAWLEHKASAAGLRGWVRNRQDGSVEALLIGDPVTIDRIATECARGPRLAAVSAVQRSPGKDDGSAGFQWVPTV